MYFYVTLTTYYVYLKPVKSKRILMWINVLSTSYCHECNLLLSMVCADQRRLCEQIALILLRILKGVSSDFPPASFLKKCTIYIYIFFWIIKFFFLDEINLQLRFHVFVCFVTRAFHYPFYYHLLSLFIIEISVIFFTSILVILKMR